MKTKENQGVRINFKAEFLAMGGMWDLQQEGNLN